MPLPIIVVDAFTKVPFAGNPAAVCLLKGPQPDAWMQSVALEMNLSETAFVWLESKHWRLRWFTPTVEVDLCGHATLATAHVFFGFKGAADTVNFETRSGRLTASRNGELIELNFPAIPMTSCTMNEIVVSSLGVRPIDFGLNGMDAMIVVASEAEVRGCEPDLRKLATVNVRGVIVTAQADAGKPYDFVSRFFAPAAGVDEDPVTGSAHCCLAPYWETKLKRSPLVGFQASKRGGTVHVRCDGNRVILGGHAITITRGEIVV